MGIRNWTRAAMVALVAGIATGALAQTQQALVWQQLPGTARDIGVGGGVAWIIGTTPEPGGYGIFRANPGGGWTKIPGAGVRIDVDRQGRAWVVTSSNGVLRFNGQQFVQVAGLQATDIGVGADGSVWAIGAEPGNDHGIYRFAYNTWEKIPGAVGTRIDVDPVGRAWVVTSSHAILRWNGSAWTQVPGDAVDIGIGGDGSVYIADPSGNVQRWFNGYQWGRPAALPGTPIRKGSGFGGGGLFTFTAQGTTNITVDDKGNPWGVKADNQVYASTLVNLVAYPGDDRLPPQDVSLPKPYGRPGDVDAGDGFIYAYNATRQSMWVTVYHVFSPLPNTEIIRTGCLKSGQGRYFGAFMSNVRDFKIRAEMTSTKDCSPLPGNSHVVCDTNAAIGSFDPNGSVIYARLRGEPHACWWDVQMKSQF